MQHTPWILESYSPYLQYQVVRTNRSESVEKKGLCNLQSEIVYEETHGL